MILIKKLVYTLCILYTVNLIISKTGKIVPINIYTIILVYIFDVFAILAIIFLSLSILQISDKNKPLESKRFI